MNTTSKAMLVLVWAASATWADVTSPDEHPVARQVTITNVNDFPEISIVGVVEARVGDVPPYVVKQGEPLEKGYKFNTLKLFAIRRDVLASAGGVGNLDFSRIQEKYEAAVVVDPYGGTVPNANPLVAEFYFYRIEVSGTSVTLRPQKLILKFNDGRADQVEQY